MRTPSTVALLAAFSVSFGQTDDLAPIQTRNQRAIVLPFLRFEPRGRMLESGEKTLSLDFSVANDLRQMWKGNQLAISEDQETQRLGLTYRAALSGGAEWSVSAPVLARNGGFMDPMIEWWHEAVLGIRNLRSETPNGRSEVIVPGSGRFGSAGGLGDVTFTYSKSLTPRLTGSVGAKLPTGDAHKLMGSGAADAGLNCDYRLAWGPRTAVFAQLGVVAQGKPTVLAGARGLVHQESLAVAYAKNSRDSWVLQWQSEASSIVTGVAGSDSTHRVVSLGYSRKLSSRQTLQMYFTEDGDWENYRVSEVANIGPDFSIGLNLITRF